MRVTSEYNLGKLYTELIKEWHPTKNKSLTPYQVTSGSGKKVWWKCKQGHEWIMAVKERKRRTRCPKCYIERKRSK